MVRAQPGKGLGRDGRIVVLASARAACSDAESDRIAAELFIRFSHDLGCEQLGELLRRLSNEVLSATSSPSPGRERLRVLARRPGFSQAMMERLTVAFRSCDRECFDDGDAVGVLSGTGYCNASLAAEGLPDDGFLYQDRLPVCQTAQYSGCVHGYTQAVNSVQGCLSYATGPFQEGFNHWVSQDCHLDD